MTTSCRPSLLLLNHSREGLGCLVAAVWGLDCTVRKNNLHHVRLRCTLHPTSLPNFSAEEGNGLIGARKRSMVG
jgi:hypothetical protein